MLNWRVLEIIKPSKYEKEYKREVAQFDSYILAEDFINLVLPADVRNRFEIEHI